ncbi:VQ motif-containing protein 4-like [Rhodamnia argentea]|uniref:VQ motif-containing protein 4-like n=1 Tax=Rhodamnia argentea TaxID=178133 RepID=A0A8B8QTP9_9MYRT|nr:VQ motif-containing protein 4-like [Rhodamnia argentea]
MSCTTSNGVAQSSTRPFTPEPVFLRPTTYVQADATAFKQVVQMLTGSPKTAKQASTAVQDLGLPPSPSASVKPPPSSSPRKQGFKLYERRNNLSNCIIMNTVVAGNSSQITPGFLSSGCAAEMLSPSALDFPNKLVLSPVTPLRGDPFSKSSSPSGILSEEKAVADKGFYLHPSPRKSPRDAEPKLLQLFPTTSGATSFTER